MRCVDEAGSELSLESVSVTAAAAVTVEAPDLEGYELVSEPIAEVALVGGKAQPAAITFVYCGAEPAAAQEPVQEPEAVEEPTEEPEAAEQPAEEPEAAEEPDEAPEAAEEPAATEAQVTVRYIDIESGEDIVSGGVMTVPNGTWTITPADVVPEGWELLSDAAVNVTVVNGEADQTEVVFVYEAVTEDEPEAEEASEAPAENEPEAEEIEEPVEEERSTLLTIRYTDEDTGDEIAEASEVDCAGTPDGSYSVAPSPANLPDGYEPVTAENYVITVTDGCPDPAEVVYAYAYKAASEPEQESEAEPAEVPAPEEEEETEAANEPDAESEPEAENEPEPEAETEPETENEPDPTAEPEAQAEKITVLTVRYVDAATGEDLCAPSSVDATIYPDGTYNLRPQPTALPDGWTLEGDDVVQVTLKDGSFSMAELIFSYNAPVQVTATPIPTQEPTAEPTVEPTATPVERNTFVDGEPINRWATTNQKNTAIRKEPKKSAGKATTVTKKGGNVWVITQVTNSSNEVWYKVQVSGKSGYVRSDLVTLSSQAVSDQRQASLKTPVPLMTATPEPAAAEPTAAPTEAATEAPAAQTATSAGASLTVRYVDASTGAAVADPTVIDGIADGAYDVGPKPDNLPEGYELVGEDRQRVNVQNGVIDQPELTFTYAMAGTADEPAATTAEAPAETTEGYENLTVRYVDAATGEDVAESTVLTAVPDGTYSLSPAPNNLPEGYELTGDTSASVTVTDGRFSVGEVIFTYTKNVAEEQPVEEELAAEEPVEEEPAEEEATEEEPAETEPAEEEATEEEPEAQTADGYETLTVRYVDAATNEDVAEATVLSGVADGTYNLSPAPKNMPEGYSLTGDTTVTITVENGRFNVGEVVFTYAAESAAEAPVEEEAVEEEPVEEEPAEEEAAEEEPAETEPAEEEATEEEPEAQAADGYETLTVRYVDAATNEDVAEATVLSGVADGTYNLSPAPKNIPEGYSLTGDTTVSITVENGRFNVGEVVFTYAAESAAEVPVEEEAVEEETIEEEPAEEEPIEEEPIEEEPAEEEAEALPEGVKNRLTVKYVDAATGEQVAEPSILDNVSDGTYNLRPMPQELPEGYELTGDESVQIKVTDGVIDQPEVVFTYANPDTAAAATSVAEPTAMPANGTNTIVVHYVDADTGEKLAADSTVKDVADGRYTLKPTPKNLPAGYTLVGDESFRLIVENGAANANEITFTYHYEKPAPATVPIHYVDANGKTIASDESVTLEPGTTSIVLPNAYHVPQDYTLNTEQVEVTVSEDGKATPSEVVFTCDEKGFEVGAAINRYATTTKAKVTLRASASAKGKSKGTINRKGSYVWVESSEKDSSNTLWYKVIYNKKSGYVRGDLL